MSTQQEPQQNSGKGTNPFPLRVRVVQIVFLVLAVLATAGLAYWQWTRFQEADGDFTNLGYAMQWPIFGIFLIVAYRKYIQYETERLQGDDMAAVPKEYRESMTEIPDDFMALPGQKTPTDLDNREVLTDDRRRTARDAASNKNTDTTNNSN